MNTYHRYLAQYMLKNGVATVDNAFNFCKHASQEKIENLTQFKTLVIELNREISKQYYKISFITCEVTNQNLIVWVNTKNDDISKYQITYSALELEYFHAILQEILSSEEHRITFIVCINITSTLTSNFSRDNGQKVLDKWILRGYYIKNGDFIHLGPRLILEFTSYLRTHCPNSICNLCSELVFTGKRCNHCNAVLHSYCLSKYLQNVSNCPCCKNIWEMLDEGDDVYSSNTDVVDETMDEDENTSIIEGTNNISEDNLTQNSHSSSSRSQRNHSSQLQSPSNSYDESGPSRKRYR